MSRPVKVLVASSAVAVLAAVVSACGTEHLRVASSSPLYQGAVLFSQRCSGCHTLSYAGTHGSSSNVRSREITNGPNFDVRCERPVTRVLYAIENGGFSGAIMPQNVVVGQDAVKVAEFVATYAGRKATRATGVVPCVSRPIGTLPAPGSAPTSTATTASTATKPTSTTTTKKTPSKRPGAKKAKSRP